jgi:hypothetical protein
MYVTWERVALTAVALALSVVGFIGRDLSKAVSGLDRTLTGFAAASTVKHERNSKEIDRQGKRIENLSLRVLELEKHQK